MPFNFTGLRNIYRNAIENEEPTLVFEIRDGIGRFVFMMFFSEDDASYDRLYILLRRTAALLELKMYGSHRAGDFNVYFSQDDERAIRNELNLQGGVNPFYLDEFLVGLNGQIPDELALRRSVETLRANREVVG